MRLFKLNLNHILWNLAFYYIVSLKTRPPSPYLLWHSYLSLKKTSFPSILPFPVFTSQNHLISQFCYPIYFLLLCYMLFMPSCKPLLKELCHIVSDTFLSTFFIHFGCLIHKHPKLSQLLR